MAHLGSIVLSGGISIGVFTGFLYVLFSGLKWASQLWRSLEKGQIEKERGHCTQCLRCGNDVIHQKDRGGGIDNCYSCSSPVCSECCIQDSRGWLCSWCLKERERNINEKDSIFSVFRERFRSIVAPNRPPPKHEGAVRDFVEKLTEGFLGGSLDHVRVNRLSEHPSYMGFMEKYQGVLSLTLSRMTTAVQVLLERSPSESRDDPTLIEVQLKHLIKEIIQEALQLPSFLEYSEKIQNNIEDLSTKTYEDILATAILNKVVENFNLEVKENAIIQSATLLKQLENEDKNWPLAKGENEIQDRIRKISAINDSEHLKLSNGFSGLTLHSGNKKAIFPEFGVDILNDSEVEDTHTEKTLSVEFWEENWLFQKKDLDDTIPAVPMLVPSPKDDIAPTIGEVNVNDLSELSDCSDSEIEMVVHSGIEFKDSKEEPKAVQHHISMKESLLQEYNNGANIVEARNFEVEQTFHRAFPVIIEDQSDINEVSYSPNEEIPIISLTEEMEDLIKEEGEECLLKSAVEENSTARSKSSVDKQYSTSSVTDEKILTSSTLPHDEQFSKKSTSPVKEVSTKPPVYEELSAPMEEKLLPTLLSTDENLQDLQKDEQNTILVATVLDVQEQENLKWKEPLNLRDKGREIEELKPLDNCPESLTFERDSEYMEEYASIPQMENQPTERLEVSSTPLQRSSSLMQLSNGFLTMKSLKKNNFSIESELEEYLPSVKQLAKHFSKNDNNNKRTHVHSLTARNPSRESQKITRCSSEKTLPITNIHNNIEFWEKMASKHKDVESKKNKGLD